MSLPAIARRQQLDRYDPECVEDACREWTLMGPMRRAARCTDARCGAHHAGEARVKPAKPAWRIRKDDELRKRLQALAGSPVRSQPPALAERFSQVERDSRSPFEADFGGWA